VTNPRRHLSLESARPYFAWFPNVTIWYKSSASSSWTRSGSIQTMAESCKSHLGCLYLASLVELTPGFNSVIWFRTLTMVRLLDS
jgi:hypothetical protein